MICYYHGVDLDGKCSAAIVKRKYPDCELIGVDYPDRPDFEKIELGDTVFIVDFSFELKDIERLWEIAGLYNLHWIDHHKSVVKKIKNTGLDCMKGKREIGKAGCELTWEYLFPDEPMPEAVRLLGRYDVFDQSDMESWENEILPFQYGMRLKEWNPTHEYWSYFWTQKYFCLAMINKGETVLQYETQRNITYARAMAFWVEFEGHKVWAINKALSNSEIFETFEGHKVWAINKTLSNSEIFETFEGHKAWAINKTFENSNNRPLWILFSYKAGIWKYSLYSTPESGIDVSEIAAKYGGGGHAGAAGFQSDKYLLEEVT